MSEEIITLAIEERADGFWLVARGRTTPYFNEVGPFASEAAAVAAKDDTEEMLASIGSKFVSGAIN